MVHSRAHSQLPGWKEQVTGARHQGSMGPAEMMGVKSSSDIIYSCDETTEAAIGSV